MAEKCICGKGCHAMAAGLGLFLIGLLLFYGFDWPKILMIIGGLAFLKGLFLYYKSK